MVLEVPPKFFESETDSAAVWNDALDESTPTGTSSVTLLPLSSKYEIFSNFGEKDCGEPSKSQHLVIDFTPDPEIDNDEAQDKCCEFWDFINSKRYLKQICVVPTQVRGVEVRPTTAAYDELLQPDTGATTFVRNDPHGSVEMTMKNKLPASHCTFDGSYSVTDSLKAANSSKPPTPKPPVCKCSKICTRCNKSKPRSSQSVQVQKMCEDLEDWDKRHPKSMNPPGPVMQYMPALQRKIPPAQDPKTCFD